MLRAVRSGMLAAGVALFLASSAQALSVSVLPSGPGLDQGFGYSCTPSCTTVYTLSAAAPTGAGSSVQFTNDLAAVELVTLSLVSVSPAFDSGPNSLSFSSLTYSASVPASVLPLGGGLLLVQQTGAASGSVVGSYAASLGGAGPINAAVDVNSLTCVVDATGTGSCGVSFGPTGFAVNDGSQALLFAHTFNLVVPEPPTLMMLAVGALGLAFMGRRRSR
jgi:hypothetical protein